MPLANPETLGTLGKMAVEGIESLTQNKFINEQLSKRFSLQSNLTGDSGNALGGYLKKFEANKDYHISNANKALEEYKANPAAFDYKVQSKAQGYDTGYHQAIAKKRGAIDPHELQGAAAMHTRNKMFGNKDELLQGFIKDIQNEHSDMKARNIVDALGVYFHDSSYVAKHGGTESRLAANLNRGNAEAGEDMRFKASKYEATSETERNVMQYFTSSLSYKAGLKHVTTPLNMLIGRTASSAIKASGHLFGQGYEAARAEMLSLNAVGQIFQEEAEQLHKFNNGVIKDFAPGSFGKFVSDNWMMPGMSFVRRKTATMMAMQGKYAALELADRLKLPDLKAVERAEYDLKRLGIDPNKVKANGFRLDTNDVRNAMFNNVNDRMMLNTRLNRASGASGTTSGRLIGQYHAYTASQANFLQKEMLAAIQKGDPMLFMKNLAMLGTVFPLVGSGVAALSGIWGGKALNKAYDEFRDGVGLTEGHRMAGLLTGLSDTAGFGVMEGYYRAAARHKLANQILGAGATTGLQLAEDIGTAGAGVYTGADYGKTKYQAKTYDPLIRDLIHDVPSLGILPNIARALDISPTQQQLNEEKPRTGKQRIALRKSQARNAAKKAEKAKHGLGNYIP